MITWICSYPRSGSAWTRQTLEQVFEQPVCVGEAEIAGYVQTLQKHMGFEQIDEDSIAVGLRSRSGHVVWVLKEGDRLLSEPIYAKTSEYRTQLAQDGRDFYVKTHRPAYAEYLPGERVFFMVRHPMAAMTSYQRFMKKIRGLDVSIEELMNGAVRRDYLPYTELFLDHCESDPRHLVQRYEDKHLDYGGAIRHLERFVGRAALPVSEADAAQYPIYNPDLKKLSKAKMTSWLGTVPKRTLAEFETKFTPLMKRLGYRMPNAEDEKIVRRGGDPALVVGDGGKLVG